VWFFWWWVFLGGCTQKTHQVFLVCTRVSEPWFVRSYCRLGWIRRAKLGWVKEKNTARDHCSSCSVGHPATSILDSQYWRNNRLMYHWANLIDITYRCLSLHLAVCLLLSMSVVAVVLFWHMAHYKCWLLTYLLTYLVLHWATSLFDLT